jgi:hypothetical protein
MFWGCTLSSELCKGIADGGAEHNKYSQVLAPFTCIRLFFWLFPLIPFFLAAPNHPPSNNQNQLFKTT